MEELPQPPKFTSPEKARYGEGDPPVVVRPGFAPVSNESLPVSDFFEWLDDKLGSESYGAPRVFDLFTLLAITLAFALMFAFLRLIEPLLLDSLPNVAIAIGFFTTLIAIAQLALWDGNKPRIASVLAGPPIWVLIAFGLIIANPQAAADPGSWFGLICSSVLGVPAGYLGGAVVAGVFLLADMFRQRFMHSKSSSAESSDDEIWGDFDQQRQSDSKETGHPDPE